VAGCRAPTFEDYLRPSNVAELQEMLADNHPAIPAVILLVL
jgi:hypothetical protein